MAAHWKEKVGETAERGEAVEEGSGSALGGDGEFLEDLEEALEGLVAVGRGSPAETRRLKLISVLIWRSRVCSRTHMSCLL